MTIGMFIILLIINQITFFIIGKMHERWEWNKALQRHTQLLEKINTKS
jgi:hypothetical protein